MLKQLKTQNISLWNILIFIKYNSYLYMFAIYIKREKDHNKV